MDILQNTHKFTVIICPVYFGHFGLFSEKAATRECTYVKHILHWFKIIKLLMSLHYETSQVLGWFLISCWSSHASDVLVSFQPLRRPCDSERHREEGGGTFLRNVGTHIYHMTYETKRSTPTDRSLWKLALFVLVNAIFH